MAANLYNPEHLIVLDRNDSKLKMAKELGATDVINTNNTDDIVSTIREIVPKGPEYAVDTTGYALIKEQLASLTTAGKLYIIGIAGPLNLSGMDIMGDYKQIIGLIEGDAIPQLFINKLVSYYKKGKFPLDKLMSFYKFSDVKQAFADFESGKIIKPVILFN